jgi:hypothetical protein
LIARIEAQMCEGELKRRRWVAEYGHVPIPITVRARDHWLVACGSSIFHSPTWKTFHDCLLDYMRLRFGAEWWAQELRKPHDDQHPLAHWHARVLTFMKSRAQPEGVSQAPLAGVVGAFLRLAYDLFTIQQSMLLQEQLIARLKQKRGFQGASYEVQVAASFVRAGFTIELENERDGSTTHCEFTARHIRTGAAYSAEAKSRHRPGVLGETGEQPDRDSITADVSRLIQRALDKAAQHERVVFIEVNVPPKLVQGPDAARAWAEVGVEKVRRLEACQRPEAPWPSAFMFFTNYSPHYLSEAEPDYGRSIAFGGLNKPELQEGMGESMAVLKSRHPAMLDLFRSLHRHHKVPHDLDWFAEQG